MNIKLPNPMSTRALINVGALLDIPTGTYVTGNRKESILNGGLSNIVGIVGTGNKFKSTLSHYMMLSASNRMRESNIDTPMHTYDTEDNMQLNIDRLNRLADRMENIPDDPLFDQEVWSIISKSEMTAEQWIKTLYEFIDEKKKDPKQKIKFEAFFNRITKSVPELLIPSFIEIDSFTEFESSTTTEIIEKGDIENSNTMFMQQGLFKTKILKDLPRISNMANAYFILTAHLGTEINMASGPFAPQPKKSLQYLKTGEKIKGVSDKLYFLTTHLWQSASSTALINQNTKMPEYPRSENDVSTDLNLVKLVQLRSKSGPSGYTVELIVSQTEGVLPSLSEFHFLKTNKFGIDGSVRSYNLDLYPDVKLSRTTVRTKIDSDKKLRRAINITSELLQMKTFMKQYDKYYCTPKELYEDIKKLGYDWDDILENTRGWWTIKQYDTKSKFLSTLDLLKMRMGEYIPYWYKKEKK